MRELRLGTWLVTSIVLALGCDSPRNPDPDTGVAVMDSGMPGPDTGTPTVDAGRDSGGGGRTCRPPMSECDLLRQDCGAGGACRYVTPSPTEDPRGLCEPAGTATEGMSCVRDPATGVADTCAEGLICDSGTCRKYCCDGNIGDCPVGQFCLGGPGTVSLCRAGSGCNVFDGSGCTTAGQSCYLAGPDRDCFSTGTSAEGEACMFLNSCVPGHGCIGPAEGETFCRKLCDPSMAAADCPTSGTYMCVMLTGVSGVGACVPMT